MPREFENLDAAIDEFLWRSWVALGVSGVAPSLKTLVIDPEGLILMTAVLGIDARLRDESVDWCSRMFVHVSKTRLRNMSARLDDDSLQAFHRYCATVNSHSSAKWPVGDASEPYPMKPSGKSTLAALNNPADTWIRFRAIFGVTARADLLLHLLVRDEASSAAELAQAVGASKRNTNATLDDLVIAGLVEKQPVRNRYVFSLRDTKALRAFTASAKDTNNALIDWVSWTRHFAELRSLRGLSPSLYRIELAKWAGGALRQEIRTQDDAEAQAQRQVELLMGERAVKVDIKVTASG